MDCGYIYLDRYLLHNSVSLIASHRWVDREDNSNTEVLWLNKIELILKDISKSHRTKMRSKLEGKNPRSHNLKQTLRVVHMDPVACIWKKVKREFSPRFIFASTGKVLKPLNRLCVPPVALLCTEDSYLCCLWWLLQQRPIRRLPKMVFLQLYQCTARVPANDGGDIRRGCITCMN